MGNVKKGFIQTHSSTVGFIQRAADALWIYVAHYAACRLYPEEWQSHHTLATVLAIVVFTFVAEAGNLYRPWRAVPMRSEIGRVFGVWFVVAPALLGLAFVMKESAAYSRFITITWFLLAPTLIALWRVVLRAILREMRKRGRNTRAVAIVGATQMGSALASRITASSESGMRVVGFYEDRAPERLEWKAVDGEIVGGTAKLVRDAREGNIDLVFIALPLRAEPRINELVRALADTTASVYVVADFFVFDLLHAQWSNLHGIPVVSIFESPFYGVSGWLKRVEDIVLGTMILGIIAVPMLIIAAAIKLTSKGPVFFKQRRYGLHGEEIRVLKFRSMTVSEDGPAVKQAQKGDARITKLGAFLRKTSLDELPQFFNVIAGTMSIVGPRPHAVAHNEEYRRLIHGYMLRHKVKPGITGWAQVNGWRGETDTLEKMEKRVEHDLHYIQNWGLMFDIKIIFLTVFGAAVRKNAY